MSESNQEPASADADEALRKRLLNRIGIAGVVVVALLGGLAVLDATNREPPPAVPPVAKAPAAESAAAATPAPEAPPEPAKAEGAAPVADAGAGVAPPAEPVAAPEGTSAVPGRPLKPLTPPATARPAMVKPSDTLAAVKPEPGRALARTQPAAPAGAGPLSRPLSQAMQSSRQFILQMGVFNNLANAEELRAKLELNGIPAQIEARVQVGPFATREEADAAREKLRALGMDSGILTAISTRK